MVPCYQFTLRSLFHGHNGKRPILSLVGDGRIPQLEGDYEIGFKLDRFNIHESCKNPHVMNTLEFDEELIQIALNTCDSPYGCYGRTGMFEIRLIFVFLFFFGCCCCLILSNSSTPFIHHNIYSCILSLLLQ